MSFSDPEKNIRQFELTPGMYVADFGAGSGFYTINAAQEVGSKGRVYAIDIQNDLLSRIQQVAIAQELDNVELVWGDLEKEGGSTLKDSSVDAVLISNLLFQVEDMNSLISEAKRILKNNGKVLVIDWSDTFGGLGPQKDDIVPEHIARNLFEENGFRIERGILAGAHHYGFIARKWSKSS
jgi:ubiquinone/menaquinone biosynthesis C-methylase UbiE